ncbi:ATP-binding protein [bacterium]|nr:ATP-binding protein [bacterium]
MIKRLIFNKLLEEIKRPEINILLGPRQVGKTTLLKQLQKYAKSHGSQTHFYDLEQPQVLAEFNTSDQLIIEKLTRSGSILFIDEFHYLENASKLFKAIYDSDQHVKIFCSGSSSLEIHKHLRESLAGRRLLFHIFPLQFSEIHASRSRTVLDDYLVYGGLPGLTHIETEERKQQLLVELLSSYILKDVKSLVKEENIRVFNHLLYLLAENQGSVISVHSLANQVNMSSKAINRYLDILEGTYVNFRIYSFSRNLGNELKKSCKTYLYDLGIRNAILKDFSSMRGRADKGVLMESLVFLKLQSILSPNMEIKFWRTKTGDEVDFILLKNRKPYPIEVKSNCHLPELPKGLKRFLDRYPETEKAFVVNNNLSDQIYYQSCKVEFIPIENFVIKWELREDG